MPGISASVLKEYGAHLVCEEKSDARSAKKSFCLTGICACPRLSPGLA